MKIQSPIYAKPIQPISPVKILSPSISNGKSMLNVKFEEPKQVLQAPKRVSLQEINTSYIIAFNVF